MTFGERLKATRENAGLTQISLAKLSGISLRTIQNWENNVRQPSKLESVAKVANVLNVSTNELLDQSEEFTIGANEVYGSRGRKGAEKVLADVNALFAGGEMNEDDMDIFMQAVQQAYWEVKAKNKQKYTPAKHVK